MKNGLPDYDFIPSMLLSFSPGLKPLILVP